jgi:hypothetical protein
MIRTELVLSVKESMIRFEKANPKSGDNPKLDPTWDELRPYIPHREWSMAKVADFITSGSRVASTLLASTPLSITAGSGSTAEVTQAEEESTSSSSSEADQMSPLASEDLGSLSDSDEIEQDLVCRDVEWLLARGSRGMIHLRIDALGTTCCGRLTISA